MMFSNCNLFLLISLKSVLGYLVDLKWSVKGTISNRLL